MKNKLISLIRNDLEEIPEYPFPSYVKKRLFVPGDEKLWIKIQTASDKDNTFNIQRFQDTLLNDYDSIAQRQYYLFNENKQPIGTGTAWYADNKIDSSCGLVHWVAILPEFQGKGLGKALVALLLNRMSQLVHILAKVNTYTSKITAINMYLKFGFCPVYRRL
jgi:GNAT superfamily N-acetyltransferase